MTDLASHLAVEPEQHALLLSLLQQHLPETTVWAYGSRVTGQHRPSSDLDLVVFTQPHQAAAVAELRQALAESDLPFRVDLFVWNDLPEDFRRNIEAQHLILVSATP